MSLEELLVYAIVAVAAAYLLRRFFGVGVKRRKKSERDEKPDVPIERLRRKK